MNASAPGFHSLPKGNETILVVEDEHSMREMLEVLLGQLGYQVKVAANGADAVALFKANPTGTHLLLADIMLPGEMNGLQVAKTFRQIRPNIPICYMTGHTRAIAMLEKCEEAGQWLHKPFQIERLAAVVRTALDEASH